MKEKQVRAFCVDFNWDMTKRFASPGLYAHANAKEHLQWYKDLGVNTIQSFCVSHNGYAWYDSDVAPVTPGMEGAFFTELAESAKKDGFDVMGYFSPGANEHWRWKYPELSHSRLSASARYWHMPYSEKYNDYMARLVEEFLTRNPIDGFMVDFMWAVEPIDWLPVERQIYKEVMGEEFPKNSVPDAAATKEYLIRSVRRAWSQFRSAAKSVDPSTKIWLSCNDTSHFQVRDTGVGAECDWLMNEHPSVEALSAARETIGEHGMIMQCVCGWDAQGGPSQEEHDTKGILDALANEDIGIYGFAKPLVTTTLPDTSGNNPNAKNIRFMQENFK